MPIRVREYRPTDLPMVSALFEVSMQRGRRSLGLRPFGKAKARKFASDYMRGQLRRFRGRAGFVRVAEVEDVPAGFVTVEVHRYRSGRGEASSSAEVQELHVLPRLRRRGVGSALLQEAERELKRRGCPLVGLFTFPSFTGAHAFYRRRGYQVVSVKFGKDLR